MEFQITIHFKFQPIFPLWVHYFVGFGPMFAALIMTWNTQGSDGLQKIGQRILRWKVNLWWWLIAILPLLFGLAICFILNIVNDNDITMSAFGTVSFLPPLGIGALFLWIFSFGFGKSISTFAFVNQEGCSLSLNLRLIFFLTLK